MNGTPHRLRAVWLALLALLVLATGERPALAHGPGHHGAHGAPHAQPSEPAISECGADATAPVRTAAMTATDRSAPDRECAAEPCCGTACVLAAALDVEAPAFGPRFVVRSFGFAQASTPVDAPGRSALRPPSA